MGRIITDKIGRLGSQLRTRQGTVGAYMQWEYKLVALELLLMPPNRGNEKKHEQILNELGRQNRKL
jgi:hypothetical protein